MSQIGIKGAKRPKYDQVLVDIADYVCDYEINSGLLADSLYGRATLWEPCHEF